MSNILSPALLQCWSSSSSPRLLPFSSRCLLKVYLCYIRPLLEYGCSSFVGLSVRSARQLEAVQQKALSICSVDSACIPSFVIMNAVYFTQTFLFYSWWQCPWPPVRFPFVHTATSRTLRNSSAIRLPRPRTSCFCPLLSTSLLLPTTLLLLGKCKALWGKPRTACIHQAFQAPENFRSQ